MTRLFRHRRLLWSILALLVLVAIACSFAIVPENQQAIVVRFGKPVRILNRYQPGQPIGGGGAGIAWRLPYPFENLVRIDRRALDLDLAPQAVTSSDQRQLEVASYARYRIVDPLRMYVRAGDQQQLAEQLRSTLGTQIQTMLDRQPYALLLAPESQGLTESLRASLDRIARPYGVEIVDVGISKTSLPAGAPLQSALDTMRSARLQEARSIRLQGLKQVDTIQDQADTDAARIYAASFGKDPQFYDFYRAMQSYRTTFVGDPGAKPPAPTTMILSPDDDYLKQFAGGGR